MITGKRRGVKFNAPMRDDDYYSRISPRKDTLSVIVRTYKSAVSSWCERMDMKTSIGNGITMNTLSEATTI